MNARHHMIAAFVLVTLAGCQHSLVRDSMPTVTRTGEVKDIVISDDLSPATVGANPGDEIRWINKRQGDVRVIFLAPVTEMLTCQRNFGGLMGVNKNEYTAKLGPNETASLCFRNPAEVKFVVRADSNVPSGEENLSGSLSIGSGDQASAGREPNRRNRRSAQAEQEDPSTR